MSKHITPVSFDIIARKVKIPDIRGWSRWIIADKTKWLEITSARPTQFATASEWIGWRPNNIAAIMAVWFLTLTPIKKE